MENIKRWFENDDENYDVTEYEDYLEAKTNIVHYLIEKPHNETNNKWMLRITTINAFDKWFNSTAVEVFFQTDIELCIYLYEHQLDIYKQLLEYLSLQYDNLNEEYEIEKENHIFSC